MASMLPLDKTSLEIMCDHLNEIQFKLHEAAKVKVGEFKKSGFLTNDVAINQIGLEALAKYQNDVDLKSGKYKTVISIVADELAWEKMKVGFGGVFELKKYMEENDEIIKEFIKDDYDRGLWNFNFREILATQVRNEIRNTIIPHITPILTKEIENESRWCNIL